MQDADTAGAGLSAVPEADGLRLLNADHDEGRRHSRSAMLRAAGFVVAEAATGIDALTALGDGEFAAIVLDLEPPGMTRDEICRRVRADPRTCDVPVVYVSGSSVTAANWADGLAAGADNHLTEPTAAGALVGTIRMLLRQRQCERLREIERASGLEALRASEERYRGLFRHAPYGIYIVTRSGRVTRANRALVSLLGYDIEEEVIAVNASAFYQRPDDREAIIADWERQGGVTNHEAAWRKRDGSPLNVRLTGRLIDPEPQAEQLFEIFVDDVTETRRVETALRQNQKMEAIGRVAAGIAHDFNNLLTAILGYTELMLEQIDATKPIHGDLREVQKAAQSAARLTRQLLAFGRKQPLQLTVVDMHDVVRAAERLLRQVLGDAVRIVITGGGVPATLKADPGQLEQVLVNLAVNARDAMPHGGTFTIAIDTVPVTDPRLGATSAPIAPGPYVRVAMTDTGAGMDPGTRTRLFEPFFSTKGPGRGTGLGLAIVDGIVTQLGGHISVRSAPKRGTTFELFFPSTGGAALPRVAQPRATVEVGRETILLVDDDPGIVILESAALTRHGYRVIAAASPDAALALVKARSEPIDLILSDIVMPGMSGPMLVQRLRESASTPVIYMSGYERTASPECQPDDGAEFLRKPFKQSDLLACVRRALDGVPPAGAALN